MIIERDMQRQALFRYEVCIRAAGFVLYQSGYSHRPLLRSGVSWTLVCASSNGRHQGTTKSAAFWLSAGWMDGLGMVMPSHSQSPAGFSLPFCPHPAFSFLKNTASRCVSKPGETAPDASPHSTCDYSAVPSLPHSGHC